MWKGGNHGNGQKKGILMGLNSYFGQSVLVAASFLVTHHWEGRWYRSSGVFLFLFKLSMECSIVVIAVTQPLYTCICLTVPLWEGVL